MNRLTRLAVAASFGLCIGAASAGPIVNGDTVTCAPLRTGTGVFGCSATSATVGSGVEFTLINDAGALFNVDFTAGTSTLTISTAFGPLPLGPGTSIFQFTDSTSPFSKAVLSSVAGVTGFDSSDVSLSSGVLGLDFRETSWPQGQAAIVLTLETQDRTPTVPEPGSIALAGMALLAAFGASRRRARPA